MEQFCTFWKLWPKKCDKKKAEAAWRKLKAHERDLAIRRIPEHVVLWLREKRTYQHIPYPTTWLNGQRWNDELPYTCQSADPPPLHKRMLELIDDEGKTPGQAGAVLVGQLNLEHQINQPRL